MDHRNWTESAVLQGVSEDAATAFSVRIQRFPARGRDWLWIHTFERGRIHGFVEEHLVGKRDITRIDAADVDYQVGDPDAAKNRRPPGLALLRRHGTRDTPAAAEVLALGVGHRGPDAPEGAGRVELRVAARFAAAGPAGASLPGRSEVLGSVTATLGIDKRTVDLSGYGHWHEQGQSTPRFTTPFTYLSLAGAGLGLVAVRAPRGASGFAQREGAGVALSALALDPVGPRRRLRLEFEDGSALEGHVADSYRYTLPIEGRPRASSVVKGELGGVAVVGMVNDWMEDEFPAGYDRPLAAAGSGE